MRIADIIVGPRFRSDLGNIRGLADSIETVGLLQPPGVTANSELVFGLRRVEAAKLLGWTEIEVRTIDPADLVLAERDENEIRKEFTPSERVAIGKAIESAIGRKSGRPGSGGRMVQNIAPFPEGKPRSIAAEKAGFGNPETYRQASKVVANGAPALVEAMDRGEVSISAAAAVAELPPAEQEQVAAAGPVAVREKAAEIRRGKSRVNGQLAEDPPDVARQRANGRIPEGVVVEVTEPESEAETPEAAEPAEPELDDEAWLETLPARAGLSGLSRKVFDADALAYRKLEKHRDTFRHHATRVLNASRRKGEYGYRVTRFLKTNHPKHWIICQAVDQGGCAGSGQVPLIGQCPECHGRGYRIP